MPVNLGNPNELTVRRPRRSGDRHDGEPHRGVVYRPLPDGRSAAPQARHRPRDRAARLAPDGRSRAGARKRRSRGSKTRRTGSPSRCTWTRRWSPRQNEAHGAHPGPTIPPPAADPLNTALYRNIDALEAPSRRAAAGRGLPRASWRSESRASRAASSSSTFTLRSSASGSWRTSGGFAPLPRGTRSSSCWRWSLRSRRSSFPPSC